MLAFSHFFHVFHPYFPPVYEVYSSCTEPRPTLVIVWKQYLSKWQMGRCGRWCFCCLLLLMEYEFLVIGNVSPTCDCRVLSHEPSHPEGCCMGFLCLSSCWWVRRISCCLLNSFFKIFNSKFWYFNQCK